MSAINRVSVPVQSDWSAGWKPLADALEVLSASLENTTVGVAFFDQRLRCHALNRAFASIWSARPEKFLGKTLQQAIGSQVRKLKSTFERVFSAGAIVSGVSIFGASGPVHSVSRHAANFYPLADDRGRVRIVAVAVSETSTLQFHLSRLVARLQLGLPAVTGLLGASFPEALARSLQSSTRSILNFRNSTSPRSFLTGTQLEIGLMPLALFLSLTGSRPPSPLAPTPAPAPEHSASLEASLEAALEPSAQLVPPSLAPSASLLDDPSPRELQVLRLLANGRSNKEIGIGLGISTRTVETYRARIIRKLGLHSTAELVRYAIRHGLVEA